MGQIAIKITLIILGIYVILKVSIAAINDAIKHFLYDERR